MASLSDFLTRRRWFVLAAWVAVVLLAMPLASKQTENLVGGGFEVPGSQSADRRGRARRGFRSRPERRDRGCARGREGRRRAPRSTTASPASRPRSPSRVTPTLTPRPPPRPGRTSVERRRRGRPSDHLAARLGPHRHRLRPARGGRRSGVRRGRRHAVPDRPAGRLRGPAGALQGGPREGREDRLPDRRPDPARRVRLARGRRAAPGARLRRRDHHRRDHLPALPADGDVGLRHQHGLDDRDRRRRRLLPVHPRPLPRGGARRQARREEARAEALATSGLAVAFSGARRVISLAGLWMVENQALRSMALGAMVVVAVAVLVATTLLPVLIRLLGHRVEAGGVAWSVLGVMRHPLRRRRRARLDATRTAPHFWERWTARVMRRPVVSVVASSAILLCWRSRSSRWRPATRAVEQFPEDHDVASAPSWRGEAPAAARTRSRWSRDFDEGTLTDPANRAPRPAILGGRRAAIPRSPRVDSRSRRGRHPALIAVYPQPAERVRRSARRWWSACATETVPSSQLADARDHRRRRRDRPDQGHPRRRSTARCGRSSASSWPSRSWS